MNVLIILRTAAWSLGRNKLRTGLTMLGVIIGVAAVVGMVSLGEGAVQAIKDQIAAMGFNLITVTPGSKSAGGFHLGAGSVITLVPDDAVAIRSECPSVAGVCPMVRGQAQVVFQNRNCSTTVQGVSPDFVVVRDWQVVAGAFFDSYQERRGSKVCVIGETVANNLFKGQEPVGDVIRIKRIPFLVVGVLAPKGQSSQGQDQDDIIVVPWPTAQRKLLGITHLQSILVSATDESKMDAVSREVAELLRRRHRIRPGEDDDFSVRTQTEIAETRQQTTKFMLTLVVVVSLIALIVGGIGVMNIMLVTVLERTREIGIRMAIGARPRQVLLQFLGEAVVLTSLGGVIGIALGIGASFGLTYFLGWPTRVTPGPVLGSFGFSAMVGIFFGLYPAFRASRLDPIDALRYE